MPADARLRTGEYARKQLFGGVGLLRFSHGGRFRMARRLVAAHAGAPLLDYGCGDGTFLALVHDLFPRAVGVEVDPALVAGAAGRLGAVEGLSFVHAGELERFVPGSFGVAVCMEVLEHCTPEAVDRVLADLWRLVAPGGTVLFSVPVETGPVLLVKQAVRALAGLRGVPGYAERERYAPRELLRMMAPGVEAPVERPVYTTAFADGAPNRYHGHKGFNWRALRRRVARDFTVRATRFSPLGPLGALANSQAWFVCTRARGAGWSA